MLDPEPPVARPVGRGHAVEDVDQHAVRPLADRVHHHLEAGGVGAADLLPERLLRGDEEPAGARRVLVRLVEQRRGGAKRPVHVALHAVDLQPPVAGADLRHRVRHPAPLLEGKVEVGAERERAGGLRPLEGAEVGEIGADVADGGDPLRGGERQGARQRGVALLGRRLGDGGPDQP